MISPGPALTFVTTCKGRLLHLQQTLPQVAAQPGTRCLVVDYGCPQKTADWVRPHFPQIDVIQLEDTGNFNIAKARNRGAQHVTTPWICFLDSDSLLSPVFAASVLPLLRDKTYWLADTDAHDLAGLVICPTADFTRIGGYDETFEGWGCEDRDLYLRLRLINSAEHRLPAQLVQAITHDDAARTRFHAVQDRFLSHRVNAMYLQVKTDLARQLGVIQLPASQRQNLYAEIKRITLAAPQASAHLEVQLPVNADFSAPPDWQLTRRWTYSFQPTSLAPLPAPD